MIDRSNGYEGVAAEFVVVAWGLVFLLTAHDQRLLIERVAKMLSPGGRLLFTSCGVAEPFVWNDAMTGLESRSLGAGEYRRELAVAGLSVVGEYDDEGQTRYFDARKV